MAFQGRRTVKRSRVREHVVIAKGRCPATSKWGNHVLTHAATAELESTLPELAHSLGPAYRDPTALEGHRT